MTNILLTCPGDAGTGGVQQLFRDLVRWLEASGRRVHLVYQAGMSRARPRDATNSWGRRATYLAMPTYVRNSVPLSLVVALVYGPLTVFNLVRLLRNNRIDVVNCHYLAEYFLHLVVAARLLHVPVVVSVHGADVDRYARVGRPQRFLLRLVMRGCDRVVACSEAMAQQTRAVFPAAADKITYIHNGVDLAGFDGPGNPPTVTRPFVLSVCRQVEKKGTDTLLRAFALLAGDFAEVALVIIGDGPLFDRNRALAQELGIDKRVVFLGDLPHSDVLPYFRSCAAFVVPSRAEPFGLVILEAAYYRKGIVATRVGGIPEIIADDVSGLLVERDDAAGMAAKIATLLGDPALAERLGARANETMMQRFLWEDRVKDYLAIYEDAGRAHRRGAVPVERRQA